MICPVCRTITDFDVCPNESYMRGLILTRAGRDRMDAALKPGGPYVDFRILAHYQNRKLK